MRVSWIIFLFLLFTSSFLTSAAYRPAGYLGCFQDSSDRILEDKERIFVNNSGDQCKTFCSSQAYRYAGTESRYECFCGHVIRIKVRSYSCNHSCPGNYIEKCGGHWQIDIYDTWQKTTTRTQSTTTTTTIKTTSAVTESGTNYIISSENMNEYSSDSGALNATDSPKKNNGDGIDHMVTMCVLLPLALFALLVGIALFIRRRRRQKIETQQVIYHGEGSIPNIYANVSMTDNQQLALEKHAVRNVPEKKQICVSNKSTKPKAEDDVEDSGYSSYSVNMQFDNEQGQKSYDHIPTLIKAQVDKTYSHLSLPIHEPKYINITHDTYSHIENSSLQRVVISDDENDDVTYNKLEMNGTLKTGKRTNGYIIDNSDYDHTEVGLTPPQEEDCYSRANHLETDGQRPESSPLYANLP